MSWTEGLVDFRVELAVGVTGETGSLWDSALWDSGTWANTEPNWITVSEDVEVVETSRGRDALEERFRTGAIRALFANETGKYNPDYGAPGPGDLTLRPGRLIRLSADASDGLGYVTQFTGYIDTISEEYVDAGSNILSEIIAYDFAGVMANQTINPPDAVAQPTGQRTSDRIIEILNAVTNGPAYTFQVQIGSHNMDATSNLSRRSIEEAQICADAEGGAFFFDKSGLAWFKRRDWLENDVRSTEVQALIGFPDVSTSPQIISTDRATWSAARVQNDIQFQRNGGGFYRTQSTVSQQQYQQRYFRKLDFELDSDTAVQFLADRQLERRQWDKERITEVVLYGHTIESAQSILRTQIGDLVIVQVETLRGWSYAFPAHVFGISLHVTADDWSATFRVDDSSTGVPPGTGGAFNAEAFSDGYFIGNP